MLIDFWGRLVAAYGVSVEKEIQFRGGGERISNVYHYSLASPSAADFESLADAVVAIDRAAYQASAVYKQVRVFGPTEGSPAANQMRHIEDLSVNGTRTPAGPTAYPELSAVISQLVGRDPVSGRKLFLRKYIRLLTFHSSGSSVATGQLSSPEITFWQAWFDTARSISGGTISNVRICTPRAVELPVGVGSVCLPYAHIRQIKQ